MIMNNAMTIHIQVLLWTSGIQELHLKEQCLTLLHCTINIQVIFHTYENGQPYEAHTGT